MPGKPALHGELLLVAVSRPDPAENVYSSALHRVRPTGGSSPWTHGERDTDPAISPDGRWVAFLRGTGESKPQLYLMPSDGGEARRLTELPLGAGAPVWAPDSRRIAFAARVPEPGRYGTAAEEGAKPPEPDAEAPRWITRFDYRSDDIGFRRDRPRRLFVLDALAGGEPGELTPLTDTDAEVSDPAWTRDGRNVLVVAPRDWDRVETLHSDLYAVDVDSGAVRLAVRTAGTAEQPVVAADGTIFFLGKEFSGFDLAGRNAGLWSAKWRDGAEPAVARRLTDQESVLCDGAAGRPAPMGDRVLVTVLNRGANELRAVPRDGDRLPLSALEPVAGERASVRGFAVHGEQVAAVIATPDSCGDVVLLGEGDARRLTDFSADLRESGIRPVEELTATAPDGYPVHGWLVLPEGEGPHPVLLAVHGGPFAGYGWGLFDEAQVYASAGYAVVLPNPRGSAGYGESHGRAVVGALGTVDVDDVLALLDAALERPETNRAKVGVMGGSYGGFMTSWLAAQHGERFVAAWSERAVNAWDSFSGSSDIGWTFADNYVGPDPVEQRERSPLSYADKIDIPFCVVHSEHDWRCPIEQAQRMFVALRRAGAPAEMLIFSGEGHELSRSGKPRHRVQRFEAVLQWWARHLD